MQKKKVVPKSKNITVAYLQVSTLEQDAEKEKVDVLKYANASDFGKIHFVEEKMSGAKSWKERRIKSIIDDLGEGDRLIVQEF